MCADIVRSFEALNRSLRHISDSRRLKQQAEMQHSEKMARLDAELNDPRTQEAKMRANAQIAPTKLQDPIGTGLSATETAYTNNQIIPGLNDTLKEHGLEYNKDSRTFSKIGFGDEYEDKKFKVAPIQRIIQQYMALSNQPTYKDTRILAHTEQEISDIENRPTGDLDPMKKLGLQKLKQKRDDIKADMADPNKRYKKLTSDRRYLNKTLNEVLITGNTKLATQIQNRLKQNLEEQESLATNGGVKNLKGVTYHTSDGRTRVFHEPHGIPHPNMRVTGSGTNTIRWKMGTLPSTMSGKGRLDKTNPANLTPPQWTRQIQIYDTLKLLINRYKIKELKKVTREEMFRLGAKDPAEAEKWKIMFMDNAEGSIDIWKKQKANMEERFGPHSKYFRVDSPKDRLKRSGMSIEELEGEETLRKGSLGLKGLPPKDPLN